MNALLRSGSLRTRLLLFVSATLVAVCAAMTLATVFAQRASLLGALDQRVTDAAERSLGGAGVGPRNHTDLGFLGEQGQAVGTLAARLDGDGNVTSAEVIDVSGDPEALSADQRAALDGIAADGSTHTRTVPGLGTYRITALSEDGLHVLTGLPMDDVQDMIGGLVVVEAAVAGSRPHHGGLRLRGRHPASTAPPRPGRRDRRRGGPLPAGPGRGHRPAPGARP